MARAGWLLGIAVAFAVGVVVGAQPWRDAGNRDAADAARIATQLDGRQADLRSRAGGTGEVQPGRSGPAGGAGVTAAARITDRAADAGPVGTAASAALARPGQLDQQEPGVRESAPPAPARAQDPATPAAGVEGALALLHRYLEEAARLGGRERAERARQLLAELRAMGSAGTEALVRALAGGGSSEERRLAAHLLGELQAPGAVPALLDVLERDADVLLRRAAASALRRQQTPEAASAMERLLADPREDRYVRMSAAAGLARMGHAQGVAGLVQIFDEANADGRGRDAAFRALVTLTDDRTLGFMRRVAASDAEPTFRLRAIRYLATQGDLQALPALQQVVHAPGEQPSIRDAAAQAVAVIGGR